MQFWRSRAMNATDYRRLSKMGIPQYCIGLPLTNPTSGGRRATTPSFKEFLLDRGNDDAAPDDHGSSARFPFDSRTG